MYRWVDRYRDGGTFLQWEGRGWLTSDLKWGPEETLLSESLYFPSKKLGVGDGPKLGADHGGVKTCFHPLRIFVYENFIY